MQKASAATRSVPRTLFVFICSGENPRPSADVPHDAPNNHPNEIEPYKSCLMNLGVKHRLAETVIFCYPQQCHNRNVQYQESIVVPSRNKIKMQQRVDGPLRTATRTEQACGHIERAFGEQRRRCRTDKEINQSDNNKHTDDK